MSALLDTLLPLTPGWLQPRVLGWFGYRVVHTAPVPGGMLCVLERGSVRHLRFGQAGEDHSAYDRADPLQHVLPYTAIAAIALTLPPRLRRVLHLGLGGGTLVRLVRHGAPGAHQQAIEPFIAVVDAARTWFDLPADVEITVATVDAALPRLSHGWDLVFLDAFTPGGASESQDEGTFAQVRRLVTPDGWLVVNALGDPHPIGAALHRIFATVGWVRVPNTEQYVLFASDTHSRPSAAIHWITPRPR